MAQERGCGKRVQGGAYAEAPLSPRGRPVKDFLVCIPQRLNFDVPVQGQLPIERNGVTHLLDWVGETHYPNVTDFVEEVKHLGLSRRLPLDTPFELLTYDSRLMTIHSRAYIYNVADYGDPLWICPKHREGHPSPTEMCAGLWWWDVIGGEPAIEAMPAWYQPPSRDTLIERTMPSFTYLAHRAPDGVEGVYSPAIFAAWPISRIAVVRGDYGEHETACEKLSALKLNVNWELVDE